MQTYTTLDNEVFDLSLFTDVERAYFERCYAAYRDEIDWLQFTRLVTGPENPILEPGARVTRAIFDSPMFRALSDLEARLGIRQGAIKAAPGDDLSRDPLSDEFVSVAEAAEQKGVSERAVYSAIDRHDIIASRSRPVSVSRNSLAHWRPSEIRQAAGRARAGTH